MSFADDLRAEAAAYHKNKVDPVVLSIVGECRKQAARGEYQYLWTVPHGLGPEEINEVRSRLKHLGLVSYYDDRDPESYDRNYLISWAPAAKG